MFGTYICPDHEPEAFGIKEETFGKSYVEQLLQPIVPDKHWQKVKSKFPQSPLQRTADNSGNNR